MLEPHWPSLPHTCEPVPLQRRAPGAQTPPHRPVVESQMFGHVVPALYVPLAPQCLDVEPAHKSVPGTHSPTHLPLAASQRKVHALAWSSIQIPLPLQVCGLPLLHCFSFGAHARHSPRLQGVDTQLVIAFHRPVLSQACTELPAHCGAAPGEHSPLHSPTVGSHTKVQASEGPQWPVASQVCANVVEPGAQRVASGLHSPEHMPLASQTVAHGACGSLMPAALQSSGVAFSPQLRVPGLHEPVHAVASPVPLQA